MVGNLNFTLNSDRLNVGTDDESISSQLIQVNCMNGHSKFLVIERRKWPTFFLIRIITTKLNFKTNPVGKHCIQQFFFNNLAAMPAS